MPFTLRLLVFIMAVQFRFWKEIYRYFSVFPE
jgi:hypothetical protein